MASYHHVELALILRHVEQGVGTSGSDGLNALAAFYGIMSQGGTTLTCSTWLCGLSVARHDDCPRSRYVELCLQPCLLIYLLSFRPTVKSVDLVVAARRYVDLFLGFFLTDVDELSLDLRRYQDINAFRPRLSRRGRYASPSQVFVLFPSLGC